MQAHIEVNESVAHPAPFVAEETYKDADDNNYFHDISTDVFGLIQDGLIVWPYALQKLSISADRLNHEPGPFFG